MSKKEQVIDAARILFTDQGYKKVSMDEIAKKSNVTKKTIYTYFKDKNDLIKYFLYEELNNMEKLINEIDKQDMPFTNKINDIIITLIEYRYNSKILNSFSKNIIKNKTHQTIEDECSTILNNTIQKEIKKKLEYAIKEGYVKECDPEITSFIIYKIYITLMFEWDKPVDKNKAIKNIMNILTTGLLK